MTPHLKIFVYENGRLYDPAYYSAPELDALIEVIEDLWSPTYNSTHAFFVELDEESNAMTLVHKDMDTGKSLPFTEEWLTKTIRFGWGKEPLKLVGDRLPVAPRQLGLSPWPSDVRVQFLAE